MTTATATKAEQTPMSSKFEIGHAYYGPTQVTLHKLDDGTLAGTMNGGRHAERVMLFTVKRQGKSSDGTIGLCISCEEGHYVRITDETGPIFEQAAKLI